MYKKHDFFGYVSIFLFSYCSKVQKNNRNERLGFLTHVFKDLLKNNCIPDQKNNSDLNIFQENYIKITDHETTFISNIMIKVRSIYKCLLH